MQTLDSDKPLIIVKIQGGIGNQLFEYVFARALSEKFKVPFALDLSNYDPDPGVQSIDKEFKRGYGIGRFHTIERVASPQEIESLMRYRRRPGRQWFLRNRLWADPARYIQERQYHFDPACASPTALEEGKSIYLDGFWQTEMYFKDIESIIRRELTWKEEPDADNAAMGDTIRTSNAVSLHVRRGSFILPQYRSYHGICPPEYYAEAIRIIMERVSDPHFFIFSDDMPWVKEHLKIDAPITYVDINDGSKDYEDLRLMSLAKHHIIANSTFSWWGAWLAGNSDKVVVAPDKMLVKKIAKSDLIPSGWVVLETNLG
jgi:hypothetical protein